MNFLFLFVDIIIYLFLSNVVVKVLRGIITLWAEQYMLLKIQKMISFIFPETLQKQTSSYMALSLQTFFVLFYDNDSLSYFSIKTKNQDLVLFSF